MTAEQEEALPGLREREEGAGLMSEQEMRIAELERRVAALERVVSKGLHADSAGYVYVSYGYELDRPS